MTDAPQLNKAKQAAEEALTKVYDCIERGKCFLVEAGAGAGKTHSLITSLKHVINRKGDALLRHNQNVACITFTNVAVNEIESRTDRHPAIKSSTIHSFCWSLIKNFQLFLREKVPMLNKWPEKLAEAKVSDIGNRTIEYDLGYRIIEEETLLLHHDDVLDLMVMLMEMPKFRTILTARFPIIFIDEYQDTNEKIAKSFTTHFIEKGEGPLIGFFGDHWQKIYGEGCGRIESIKLEVIKQKSNFRSVKIIVDALNRIRHDLPQEIVDPEAEGTLAIYHTNEWMGERRTGNHWAGDLPEHVAQKYLASLRERLNKEGWDFGPDKTKILMLTNKALASTQGYSNIANIYPYSESYLKKEDPLFAFILEKLEPACENYSANRFGEMFFALDSRIPAIRTHADKIKWTLDMNILINLRATASVGEVLDHLMHSRRPRLPEAIESKEKELAQASPEQIAESNSFKRLKELREVPYQEIMNLGKFVDEHTPFSTKHGVKGAEFENVLVIFGRGWNQYNFNQMLEWFNTTIPAGKEETFERNRNLFYVVCSRPKKRLALLFTQELSADAIKTLTYMFGKSNIHALANHG